MILGGSELSSVSHSLPAHSAQPWDPIARGVVPRQPLTLAWFPRLITGIVIGDALAIALSLIAATFVRFGVGPSGLPDTVPVTPSPPGASRRFG